MGSDKSADFSISINKTDFTNFDHE